MTTLIEHLPDEILDFVLSLLLPYHDLDSCKLVSKKWNSAVKRVVRRKQNTFYKAIKTNNLTWEYGMCEGISSRHLHAACFHDGNMYIYGGLSEKLTSFNDLAVLDLSQRRWRRIISSGNIPLPKAGATLCAYKNKLILYGGYNPSSLTPFGNICVNGELHTFDISSNIWTRFNDCLSVSKHTATVHKNLMVTYGGLYAPGSIRERIMVRNVVLCLNLDTMVWSFPECTKPGPPGMLGHSQIYLDEEHLLIIGGMNSEGSQVQGSWLLTMGDAPWKWRQMSDINHQWMPPKVHGRPVVKVDKFLVAFSGCTWETYRFPAPQPPAARPVIVQWQRDENVNGRWGDFQRPAYHVLQGVANVHGRPGVSRLERRSKQLSVLEKFEKKYSRPPRGKDTFVSMNLYVADISDVVRTGKLVWQQPRYSHGCPADRICYSLTVGNSELIMMGGLDMGNGMSAPVHQIAFGRAPRFFL